MKRPRVSDNEGNNRSRSYHWKRRPSEIRGYNRVLYTTTERGDYLRVDYNLKDKKVRLYIEDSEEGGNPYYTVISNGNVTVERNSTTGRITSLFEKINKRANIFSTIPNKDVLKLVNRNYGIGLKKQVKSRDEIDKRKREREKARKSELEETRRKYFKPEEYPFVVREDAESSKEAVRIAILDFVDIVAGASIGVFLYFYTYNMLLAGIALAAVGVIIGFVDVYIRGREIFFTKVFLFLIAGIAAYIYGYYFI